MKNNKTITVRSYVRRTSPSKKVMVKTGYKGDYRFVPIKGTYLNILRFMKRLFLSALVAIPAAYLLMQLFIHVNESANLQRELNEKQVEVQKLEETNKRLKEEMAKNMVKCSPSKNESVNTLLNKYFKTCNEVVTMYALAHAECDNRQICHNRGLNRNGSIDFGYFNINTIHRNKGETIEQFEARMYVLEENFKLAAKVYNDRKKIDGIGYTAWSSYGNKKFTAKLMTLK